MSFNFPPADDPTMKNFWSVAGSYYRGHKKVNPKDIEVPTPPPSVSHVWTNSGWKLDETRFFDFLRRERNFLLEDSDKYMLEDFPITLEKKEEWKTYRQLLRDLPETINPNNPVFPEPPKD